MPASQQMFSQVIAYLTTLIGLSLLAGWYVAFRVRVYVGWLGLAFLSLAAMFHLRRAGVVAHDWLWLTLAAVFFIIALVAAARESGERLRALQAEQQAAENAFLEMVQAEVGKKEGGGEGEQAVLSKGDEERPEKAPES